MINKPTIIIASGGRTGTKFFSDLLGCLIDNSVAFHEPERLTGLHPKYFKEIIFVVKNFGLYKPTVKKMMGEWGITSISNKRIMGGITQKEAAQLLIQERENFIDSFPQRVYIESSYHYYGLIDIIPKAFKYQRVVYIIRDGRDWVRSHINKTKWYSWRNPHTWFKTIIHPPKNDPYHKKWKNMSPFAKLCWMWTTINQYAFESIKKNPGAKLFYFEDIFESNNKYENLERLIDFVTDFGDFRIPYNKELLKGSLEKKVNKPKKYSFPAWPNWTQEQKRQFNEICGETMKGLGYPI